MTVQIKKIDYEWDSVRGSAYRVATIYYSLLQRPEQLLSTVSYSCEARCPLERMAGQLKVGSLKELIDQSRPAYLLRSGEIHLYLLPAREIWNLAALHLLIKGVLIGFIRVLMNRIKRRRDQELY